MTTRPTLKKTIVAAMLLLLIVGWIIHIAWQRSLAFQLQAFGAEVTFERMTPRRIDFARGLATFSNEQMPLLTRLPHLRSLDLVFAKVTDEGLESVEQMPHLDYLTVRVSQISIERERRLRKRIVVSKIRIIRGRRVADGFE